MAQDSCKNKSSELKHGIQFQITDFLNITNYRGYTFAYRFLLNDRSGLRFGFKVNYGGQEDDRLIKSNDMEYDAPYETSELNIKLSAQYLSSILTYDHFSFILGGGPFILIFDNKSESFSAGEDYVQEYTRNENGLSYGIDLIAGVEYKLTKNVIISGESGIYFGIYNSEYERIEILMYEDESRNQIKEVTADSDKIKLGELSVNLGISVYF